MSIQYPALKPTPADAKPKTNANRLELISLNDDQFCVYTTTGLAKVFTRSARTGRF